MGFFNTLNYSSCNEDGLSELRALDISSGDSVCCITGSGDRPLHMLLGDPSHVLAFDLNPAQNHLLELKMAAIRSLDYSGFIEFLGLKTGATGRWEQYLSLRDQLSPEAASWFNARSCLIKRGILYQGRWERYFRMASISLRLLRGNKISQLFAFDDLDQQRRFVHEQWNSWAWRWILRLSFNPFAFRLILRDPGFYRYANRQLPAWSYIYDRMTCFLEHHLARSSFMMALVFYGRLFNPHHYPPYLKAENFRLLKARLDRLSIRTASLFEVLDDPALASCNKYSLSDVSSFLSPEEYHRLLTFFASKETVRFCLRDFLTNRMPPMSAGAFGLRFLADLQEQLATDDTSFGYTFTIGVKGTS